MRSGRSSPAGRGVFVASTVAIGYAHFTGLTVVVGEVAFYLLLLIRGERPAYRFTRFVADLVAAGIAVLPLVPLILTIAGRRANFLLSAGPVTIDDLVSTHRQVVYLLLPAVVAAVVAFARNGTANEPARPAVTRSFLFLLVVFYATAIPLWIFHRAGGTPTFKARYTTILYLLPIVAAGLCSVAWTGRSARVAFALTALLLGQVTEGAARRLGAGAGSPRLAHEDWREAVRWVNDHSGGQPTPVFIRGGLIESDEYLASGDARARKYLTLPVLTIYPLVPADRPAQSLTFLGDLPGEADVEAIRAAGEVWFVVKGEGAFADQVATRASGRIARDGLKVEVLDRKVWRNVVVLRLRVTSSR